MVATRIWIGDTEFSNEKYYTGQILITEGRKRGCYQSVTKDCKTEDEARHLLTEYVFNLENN